MATSQTLDVFVHVSQLRSGTEYRNACRLLRRNYKTREDMTRLAKGDRSSEEFEALRFLIGTWERIAIIFFSLNKTQRQQVFPCNPVSLIWIFLNPAIVEMRKSRGFDNFASKFEALHQEYQAWIKTKAGHDYRTAEQQAICALFC
jgi:hypothetical protein